MRRYERYTFAILTKRRTHHILINRMKYDVLIHSSLQMFCPFLFFFSHFQEFIKTRELKTARVNAIPLITLTRILMHFSA